MTTKIIDYQCPACGAIKEDFEGEYPLCQKCKRRDEYGVLNIATMYPTLSPKINGQRWKHND